MTAVLTKKRTLSRRSILRGLSAIAGAPAMVALPPLAAMFNSAGNAYAAAPAKVAQSEIPTRFVLWFNGNGITEKYWIPLETGSEFALTPCLAPLAPFRNDIHVITGLDNPAARLPGPGNDHHRSMSALVSGTQFTGRGAGGASIDQVIAAKVGGATRFRSLQLGVSQESFGESIQRNMSWSGYDRALPPEMLPNRLFDRLFGARDAGWIQRKKSVLDAVQDDASSLRQALGKEDQMRLEEHLSSIRDVEKAIASLPPAYRQVDPPEMDGDMKDWPKISRLQSDLLVHALASGQTRVASYMLTKCQGLSRFPWLGHTAARHHDYTHADGKAPGSKGSDGQRIMRDICKWHVEEFAYLLGRLKSTPEGDGNVLDRTCLVYIHEHAEANDHKNNGLSMIVAGHAGKLRTGTHTRTTGTVGDLYLAAANKAMGAGLSSFPTSNREITGIFS
ncbi:MAG TPA: DUF1552 domain-containing protein [Bryobacteraceae bacterium]|nr:DUF1552 domain-containing protein [Bryobacteraceae bacterium]